VFWKPISAKALLKQKGYSSKAIKEIWKWYDFSERRGSISNATIALVLRLYIHFLSLEEIIYVLWC